MLFSVVIHSLSFVLKNMLTIKATFSTRVLQIKTFFDAICSLTLPYPYPLICSRLLAILKFDINLRVKSLWKQYVDNFEKYCLQQHINADKLKDLNFNFDYILLSRSCT